MLNFRNVTYLQCLHRCTPLTLVAVLLLLGVGTLVSYPQPTPVFAAGSVTPIFETQPMPHPGDSADDPAIWIHPHDPAQSTVIGTNKQGGIAVYSLSGRQLQYRDDGNMNNVDLRYNVPLGGQRITLVVATNRSDNSLALYTVNPATRMLEPIAARMIQPGVPAYGACMYYSARTGNYYVFVTSSTGTVEQWKLFDTGSGKVDATRVRSFSLSSGVEGCVVDDELGRFYVSQEQAGIWRFDAEPDASSEGIQVDSVNSETGLTADVEGLTLYYTSNRTGYLMVSSQGTSSYLVYRREGDNGYLGTFVIGRNSTKGIDAVQGTDGIDVTNANLGPSFPQGLFVAQDDANSYNGDNYQNFKLVPWQVIANAFDPDLAIDTSWDPRRVGNSDPSPGPSPSPSPSPSPTPSPCPSPAVTPLPTEPEATTRTFTPVADARVEEANSTTNFGDHCILRTDGASPQRVESYVQFSVTGINRPVLSAKLRLYTITDSENGPGVYTSTNNWAESSITWNTAPGRRGEALDNLGATPANTWIEYDVTPAVTANGTYSFVLAGSSGDGLQLSSREGPAQPQLVLTLGAPAHRLFVPLAQWEP